MSNPSKFSKLSDTEKSIKDKQGPNQQKPATAKDSGKEKPGTQPEDGKS